MRAIVLSEPGPVENLEFRELTTGLELVGTPTLPDTLAATRVHGTVCFAGMLANQWIVPAFYPHALSRF